MKYIKPLIFTFRNLRLAASLAVGLFMANAAFGGQLIQSVAVTPNPLITGRTFSISVTASPEATRATAKVDFRAGQPKEVQIELTKQGDVWTGSGTVPSDILRELPANAGAMARVTLFDADGRRDERLVVLGVKIETISALFADGVLTITGDELDNIITVSRDVAGTLFVNGGAVPVVGGRATVNNTSLIRILGRKGNDVLAINEVNGALPSSNILGEEGNDLLTGGKADDEIDGGPGDDTIFGRGGEDRIFGREGNDSLSGGGGNDQLFGGDEDDVIDWFPGDGSDVAEGEDGQDKLLFAGSNNSEIIDISANGPRLLFSRNPGLVTMDCDGIERVSFQALGGADQININDLTNTQVRNVAIDLFGTGGIDDAQGDTVVINGTAARDSITASGSTNELRIAGLTSAVTVVGAEQNLDRIVINAGGDDDVVDASAVQAGVNDLTINGGNGIDTLTGGHGNDQLVGAQGTDTVFGGEGDDTLIWNPGDGNDVFEGQAGQDTMLFNGANIAETISLSANGSRLTFTRNIASITMDCDGIETVLFNARGEADNITINDLSGTAVREVKLDLSAIADGGTGDTAADTIIVKGTGASDVATVSGSAGGVNVIGLPVAVSVLGSVAADDRLIVQTFGGDDVINASGLPAGIIGFTGDGGDNDDVLVGGGGNDTLLGGAGDDVLTGGPGVDVLDGGPGANIILQD